MHVVLLFLSRYIMLNAIEAVKEKWDDELEERRAFLAL